MQISEVMKSDDVLIDVSISSKPKLLKFVAETAAARLGVAAEEILGALQGREELGSTGIGAGIAIPHAPVKSISAPFILLIRLAKPIDFEAVDEEPVDIVCPILTPQGDQGHYLKLLSQIARQLRLPDAIKAIRSGADQETIYRAFVECDG
ncbi:PTS system nitrogen regulatory IIA component [Ochrobactrum daejeonense]|uniref:PTS system nitrogen regulatory IIA component n=1 Tax=Brucella daejeonensis TaxID=659015 RepID=A0A7W9EKE8_9HYPH|nr:PTS sugar transporter subunit IIA [Brucella daejeonensis]MBB5701219.1 PTS system nitrogen regulatory IIA component [Brucella daejeonensis]